jgi:hypothetical protein
MDVQRIHFVTSSPELDRIADNENAIGRACWRVSNVWRGESRKPGRNPKRWSLLACLLGSLLCATPALASVCVSTPSELDSALTAASSNGIDDEIRVVVGNYLLTSELVYFAAPTETGELTVVGGWAPNCLVQATSGETTLDGQDMVRPLYVYVFGPATIRRLNFVHGKPTDYAGGGLNISSGNGANLTVESNAFVNNAPATEAGGGIYMASDGTIVLRNNLFFFNTGITSAAFLVGNLQTFVTGNTFVVNQLPPGAGLGALDMAGSGHYWVSNNILWNNQGNDVYDQSGAVDYLSNDIGVIDGLPPLSMIGNLSVDPMFDGFLSTRLSPSSPLVNAGSDAAPGGLGLVDESGAARRVGLHVDIGAFETDVLMRSGFEPLPSPPEEVAP